MPRIPFWSSQNIWKYIKKNPCSVPVWLPVIIKSVMWQIWLAWSFVAFLVCLHIWSFLIQTPVPETCSNPFMLKSFEVLFFTVLPQSHFVLIQTEKTNKWKVELVFQARSSRQVFARVSCPVQNMSVLLFRPPLGKILSVGVWSRLTPPQLIPEGHLLQWRGCGLARPEAHVLTAIITTGNALVTCLICGD